MDAGSPTISGLPGMSGVAVFGPPAPLQVPLTVFSYESKDCLPKGIHIIIFVPTVLQPLLPG